MHVIAADLGGGIIKQRIAHHGQGKSVGSDLRTSVRNRGISQEELAHAVGTTATTISRRETATYKPAVSDLEKLARYFGVSITAFFPEATPKSRTNALLSATAGLDETDLDEVRLYALLRKFRRVAKRTKR